MFQFMPAIVVFFYVDNGHNSGCEFDLITTSTSRPSSSSTTTSPSSRELKNQRKRNQFCLLFRQTTRRTLGLSDTTFH
jgi:hypothetical protein